MDAFETIVSTLLRHEGFWTIPSYKVELTSEEKRAAGKTTAPRWELDIVDYQGATNHVLVVECKSFIDSAGLIFKDGAFGSDARHKLFTDTNLAHIVLNRLKVELESSKACAPSPRITHCLAVGNIANRTKLPEMKAHFKERWWLLFDPSWMHEKLTLASQRGYENDVMAVVAKILLRQSNS
jgi:hypothetical protein